MNLTFRFLTLTVAVSTLLVQGCKTTPTEPEVTLEELLTHLNIAIASATGSGSASRAANAQSPLFQTEPSDNQFAILGPNTDVLSSLWPIVQQLPITARWSGDDMVLGWPAVDPGLWPDLDVAGGTRFGNTWIGYTPCGEPNNWVAFHTEWVRRPHEAAGTTFPLLAKLEASAPCSDYPVAQWLAGPSRHTPNNEIYRRRTNKVWFRWGDMSDWVWPSTTPAPPPIPAGPPELNEIHVFITGISAVLADGSTLSFDNQIGDVELFTINGQPHQIADAPVPLGQIASITFTVDAIQSRVRAGGQIADLNFAEEAITVEGPWTVGSGTFTTVTLTIDIDASMSWNQADGSWTFSPMIMIDVTTG